MLTIITLLCAVIAIAGAIISGVAMARALRGDVVDTSEKRVDSDA